jgi:hypothetical protein
VERTQVSTFTTVQSREARARLEVPVWLTTQVRQFGLQNGGRFRLPLPWVPLCHMLPIPNHNTSPIDLRTQMLNGLCTLKTSITRTANPALHGIHNQLPTPLADRSDAHRTRICGGPIILNLGVRSPSKNPRHCAIWQGSHHRSDSSCSTVVMALSTLCRPPRRLCRKIIRAYTLNNKRPLSETSAPSSWLRGNRVVMAILTINIHSSPKKSADRNRSAALLFMLLLFIGTCTLTHWVIICPFAIQCGSP